VRILLGFSYYGTKRFPEAARQLKAAAEADPGNLELHHVLAQSCLWAKDYSCALDEFRHVLQLDPDSASAHMLAGEALDGMQRTREAVVEFQAAAKAAPAEPNVHFGLGYLYWKSHRYAEAKQEFQSELSNDPKHAQAWAYLGDIEMKNNNPEGALTLLQKSIQLKSDLRIAQVDRGRILTEQKRYDEAIAAFRRAIELDPEESDAHYRLGRVYQLIGKIPDSQKEFAKVSEIHDKSDEDMVRKMSAAPPALSEEKTR
jgi:tetratricopeptide (TPR) repeat protein